jgi:hypothetical protein
MSIEKPPVDRSDAEDARRYRAILAEPEGYMHMLNLLRSGKGDDNDFSRMLDRIERSREMARAKATL